MNPSATVLVLCLLPVTAFGHHSMAEFIDSESIELTGVLSEVKWGNPHIQLELLVRDDTGEEELWRMEGFPRSALERGGIPSNVVAIGDVVTVAGFASSRRARYMAVRNILLPDRTELLLGWTAFQGRPGFSEARWPQASRTVGGEEFVIDEDVVRESEESANGIFRVWRQPRGLRGWSGDLPLTDEALAQRTTFDVIRDNPYANCAEVGMPRAMFNAWPIEFVDDGDRILIQLEAWGQTRTIHLNADGLSEEMVPTPLGHSVGEWEDGALVVHTTGIDYDYFDTGDGTPQSSNMEVRERFSLSEDEMQLSYEVVATDPETFTRPVTGSNTWEWTPAYELTLHECVPDV